MGQRLASIEATPIGFAHRGARADAPENTIEAFALALELGASGLETDAWLSQDGEVVLDHDGTVRRRFWRRPLADLPRRSCPAWMPTLDELYDAVGTDFDLSIDVKVPDAAPRVVDIARNAGAPLDRLWLCHSEWQQAELWRALSDDVRLVDSTRLKRMKKGPERRAAALAQAGIDAVNLHESDWTGGLTTLFHRFGRRAFGWDAQHARLVRRLVAMGIDGVYSDHVASMMDAIGGPTAPE